TGDHVAVTRDASAGGGISTDAGAVIEATTGAAGFGSEHPPRSSSDMMSERSSSRSSSASSKSSSNRGSESRATVSASGDETPASAGSGGRETPTASLATSAVSSAIAA